MLLVVAVIEKNKKNSCALHPWGLTCLLLCRGPGGTSADRYRVPRSTLCIWILMDKTVENRGGHIEFDL